MPRNEVKKKKKTSAQTRNAERNETDIDQGILQ
jgi:hypothetical protein